MGFDALFFESSHGVACRVGSSSFSVRKNGKTFKVKTEAEAVLLLSEK